MTIIHMPEIKFSKEPPAIWPKLEEKTGIQWGPGIVVTYGNTVHSMQLPLPEDVVVHERVHVGQQLAYPGGPDAYVDRYLSDPEFRFNVERDAYRTQWLYATAYMIKLAVDKRHYTDRLADQFLLDLGANGIYENTRTRKEILRAITKP